MKTLGIIGGIGPESTIDYYRSLLAVHRQRHPESGAPSILINSIDLQHALALLTDGRLKELVEYLAIGLRRLSAAGADFALLAANTPHLVFDDLTLVSPLPLVSIVEA